jgi:glycosyltransferase involved in cell wall biosynthesis
MTTTPQISVLMPCFNTRPYIAAAVESILLQSLRRFELVLVDNGSTDGTYEYIQGLADPRIRVFACPERGLGRALTFGLERCRAPLIARMDSDDISLPDRLELQAKWMEGHPQCVGLGTQFRFLYNGKTGAVTPTPLHHHALRRHLLAGLPALCHPTLMFRTDCARRFGGYRLSGSGEDVDFYLRLSEHGEIATLPQVLLLYRLHASSASFAHGDAVRLGIEFAVHCARVRQTQAPEPTFSEFLQTRGRTQKTRAYAAVLGSRLYRKSIFARIEGRPLEFVLHLIAAAALNPQKTLLHLERLPVRAGHGRPARQTRQSPPDFVVVGAPKCGTTAIHQVLQEHPCVFLPAIKEPHYFASELGSRRDVESLSAYDRLFASAQEGQMRGESSVRYLSSPNAIAALLLRNPGVKIIALVRNPIDLFVSWHNQCIKSTEEDVADPERAWRLQARRTQGTGIPRHCQDPTALEYRRICSVGIQIERLMELAPPSQRLVIVYDDLASEPVETYRSILRFLRLADDGRQSLPRANSFSRPRSIALARIARACQVNPILKRLRTTVKPHLQRWGIRAFERLFQGNYVPTPRPCLSQEFREALRVEFREEVALLSRLLDRDLSHWLASQEIVAGPVAAEARPAAGAGVRG